MDPLADKFTNWSLYQYVHNNPLKFTDPDGRAPRSANGDPPMWGYQEVMSRIQGIFDNVFVNGTNTLNKVGSNSYVFSPQAHANAEKVSRITKYTGIAIGGIATAIVSSGTGVGPYAAAFGVFSGVYATSAGVSMTAAEVFGEPDAASNVPGSSLAVFGRAFDEATNNQYLSAEAIGDIANGFLTLDPKNFNQWDALNTTDKLSSISGMIDGLFKLTGQSIDPKLTDDYSNQILNQINSCKESCDGN